MERWHLLQEALSASGGADPATLSAFQTYHDLLLAWSARINLISRKDEGRLVARHFIPCIGMHDAAVFPPAARVMDLGSGGGFPGIPLKLMRPDLQLVLVESKRKKVLFLREVIDRLALSGIDAVLGRVEALVESLGDFDAVVSRAVTEVATLARWSAPYLQHQHGALMCLKGTDGEAEAASCRAAAVEGVRDIRVQRYDPFPRLLPLKESRLVIVQW